VPAEGKAPEVSFTSIDGKDEDSWLYVFEIAKKNVATDIAHSRPSNKMASHQYDINIYLTEFQSLSQ